MDSASSSPEISLAQGYLTQSTFSYENATFEEVIEDLSSRFIVNLPDHELARPERVFLNIEQAHWYYDDFIRPENPRCRSYKLKEFSRTFIATCPLLHRWLDRHDEQFETFMKYRQTIPVCGAIMFNSALDKCILVKGWKSSSGWSFPRGKINEREDRHECAAREIREECGIDITPYMDPNRYIEHTSEDQILTFYLVPNVPEDYPFETQTRKEISRIEWFKVADLPWSRGKRHAPNGKFYMVTPFVGRIREFCNEQKKLRTIKTKPTRTRRKAQKSSVSSLSEVVNGIEVQSSDYDSITPSPHYSEGQQDNGASSSVDPHLAKLLSSLDFSSAPAADSEPIPSSPSNLAPVQEDDEHALIATPLPNTTSLPTPIPKIAHLPESLSSHDVPSHVNGHRNTKRLPPSPMERVNSLTPTSEKSDNVTKQSPANGLKTVSPPQESLPSVSPRASRRTSSTADISPYLAKSMELPTSSRRMRHLALLESVADESSRMSPMIRAASVAPLPQPLIQSPANGSQQMYAAQQAISQDPNDLRALYSSSVAPGAAGLQSMYGVPPPHPGYPTDPSHMRPRTSMNYHRPAYPTASGMPSGGMSMGQAEMLSFINQTRPPPPPMAPAYPYPPQTVPYPGPPPMPAPQPQYSNIMPSYPSYGAIPPQVSPMVSRAAPEPRPHSSYPVMGPPVNGPPFTNGNNGPNPLLHILNRF